jgi:hypothetical protein
MPLVRNLISIALFIVALVGACSAIQSVQPLFFE